MLSQSRKAEKTSSYGEIIQFPFERVSKTVNRQEAEIVILPCVRYEWHFETSYKKKKRKTA